SGDLVGGYPELGEDVVSVLAEGWGGAAGAGLAAVDLKRGVEGFETAVLRVIEFGDPAHLADLRVVDDVGELRDGRPDQARFIELLHPVRSVVLCEDRVDLGGE